MFLLALVAALPQSASAQDAEEGATSEQHLQEPAPSPEPAPEEPALQLKLDAAGVDVAPSPPRTADGYTLEETDLRLRRAKIGLGVCAGVMVLGGVLMGVAAPNVNIMTGEDLGLFGAGMFLAFGGLVGTIVSGGMHAHRRRQRRELLEAHYGQPRRVQWDLARSRLVF
jgi:hypothetical protein